MSDIAIKVEGLSKLYHIGSKKSGSLRESLMGIFKRSDDLSSEFWALQDVSFEIKKGEAVGIIGRNGAGKSTLLKILSRITEPTKGVIDINGRVSSLLEVGTGFHPELTGRENIFLNGTILGMTRKEVKMKFDEIVDFSGIEKFLDTPVKHYSSGMYVRLAFAVAAHLEPEILIIDEVLAVGDAEFQKKCLGKMDEVSKNEGRTVIFVSHNMNAVERLCTMGISLKEGALNYIGNNISKVIDTYISSSTEACPTSLYWIPKGTEFDNEHHTVRKFALLDKHGNGKFESIKNDQTPWIYIEGEILQEDIALNIGYAVYDENQQMLFWSFCKDSNEDEWPVLKKGEFKLKAKIPERLLNEGKYRIDLISSLHFRKWYIEPGKGGPSLNLEIRGGLSDSPYWLQKRRGIFAPVIKWV